MKQTKINPSCPNVPLLGFCSLRDSKDGIPVGHPSMDSRSTSRVIDLKRAGMTLFILICYSTSAFAGDFDSLITFLPKQKYVSAFTANGNEHRISYNKLLNRNSLIGSMGGIFPMANIQFKGLDAHVSSAS